LRVSFTLSFARRFISIHCSFIVLLFVINTISLVSVYHSAVALFHSNTRTFILQSTNCCRIIIIPECNFLTYIISNFLFKASFFPLLPEPN
jgi:hypothetical protein